MGATGGDGFVAPLTGLDTYNGDENENVDEGDELGTCEVDPFWHKQGSLYKCQSMSILRQVGQHSRIG